MTTLIRTPSNYSLATTDIEILLERFRCTLRGRVSAAYIFGSVATGEFSRHSDIDLILIAETTENFVDRPLQFKDLFDIFPNLDILVYTQAEFEAQLADSSVGFWKSVRTTMKRLM